MKVELALLKPNPLRDFSIDPIDQEVVEAIKESIRQDEFWGGVVCRQKEDGAIEIAAGHHRVQAAIAAGIKEWDVQVAPASKRDDVAMIRIYARENATQRGNSATARTGSVAVAVRMCAKELFFDAGESSSVREPSIGRKRVLELLGPTTGITEHTVKQDLANLKASGDYARIINEVKEEVDRQKAEAEEALRKAQEDERQAEERAKRAKQPSERRQAEQDRQKAEDETNRRQQEKQAAERAQQRAQRFADKAAEEPPTFDFQGVSKHLKTPAQIEAFRETVTSADVAPLLAIEQQAPLAEHIVQCRAKLNDIGSGQRLELTADFVRARILASVNEAKRDQAKADREALNSNLLRKAEKLTEKFVSHLDRLSHTGYQIAALKDESQSKGLEFEAPWELLIAIQKANDMLVELKRRLGGKTTAHDAPRRAPRQLPE